MGLGHTGDTALHVTMRGRYFAARSGALPGKVRGFNLEGILTKLGVKVTPTQMGPQTADVALERDAMGLLRMAARARSTPDDGEGKHDGDGGEEGAQGEPAAAAGGSGQRGGRQQQQQRQQRQQRQRLQLPGRGQQPVLCVVSDDHGFEALLKAARQDGWNTVVVANTAFQNADVRLGWDELVYGAGLGEGYDDDDYDDADDDD